MNLTEFYGFILTGGEITDELKCTKCGMPFKGKQELDAHIKKDHPL